MDATASSAEPATTERSSRPAPAIKANGLRKVYGDTVAVAGLDLEVTEGTVLGFLGPNGAGKTTVIRMLSTVLRPDRGSFAVAGVPDSSPMEIRRRIGVLPEGAGYPAAQTAQEWLQYHARLYGAGRREAREESRRLLAVVGLADRAGSRCGSLSRGLRQRLGIARAMANNPEVVFLDEPTLGLDPAGQRQVLDLIAGIARDQNVTVMLSTHTLAEVEQVCSRIIILNHGLVVADGTVPEIVRRAGAPRRGVVTVPADLRDQAVDVLSGRGIDATAGSARRDEIELVLPAEVSPEQASSAALRALLDGEVPVLGFTMEGGRLSDAFLAMTEGAGSD